MEAAAFDIDLAARRAVAEQDITELPVCSEPYFHLEDHEGSPGYDEGQLLSRLPRNNAVL